MNFTQLQERVRLELLRRIERGTLSVSLLARQTELGQGHISNFLHGRRQLSLRTLDKIMKAQHLSVAELLPAARGELMSGQIGEFGQIPLVSHAVALFEPYIRASSVQTMLAFPAAVVKGFESRCSNSRKQWERFVAVRITTAEAWAMEPVLLPGAVVVLDRHYTSFKPYREGMVNLYAARVGTQLLVRYAQYESDRVVLRPHQARLDADVVAVGVGETPNDVLVGRVALVLNEF
jgi:transcriptional regulator with XRE-family HTH domain